MTSHSDLIADASGIMYMNKYASGAIKDVSKVEAFKLWNFNFKAAPKAGISIAHNWTKQQEWADDKYAAKEKNSSKLTWKKDDIQTVVTAANDKWAVKISSPLVTDEWKVAGAINVEEKPQASRKLVADINVESPDMSGATVVLDIEVETEWKMKKEWTAEDPKATVSCAVNVEKDYYIGASAEFQKEVKDAEVIVMKKADGNKYWVGANMDRQVHTGCMVHNAEKKFTHAYELVYDAADKAEPRLAEQPMHIAAGGKYNLSDKTTMNYMFQFSAMVHAQAKFAHKIDKNWSVAAQQSFDMGAVEKKHPYQVGFDVNYTL